MKSKNVCRIKFGLTRIVALFVAAAMLTFGVASCSSDSGDSGDEAKTYFVKVEKAEHGTVVASPEKSEAGKTITLVATAEDGYVFEAYSVKDADGNLFEVKDDAFKMPASDVTVSATFKEEEKAPDTPTDNPQNPEEKPDTPTDNPQNPEVKPDTPADNPQNPEEKPDTPTDNPQNPEEKPDTPADNPQNPEENPDTPADNPQNPEEKTDTPTDNPQNPEEKPDTPADNPQNPEEKPDTPADNPQNPEENPDTPVVVKKYTVTFDVDGAKTTETVEENAKVTKPVDPIKEGYTFEGWYTGTTKFNFATEITGNITLTAKWTPDTNTAYKVLHYQQNAENDEYTLSDTENLTGTTGEQTTAEAKTYAHFTAGTVTQAAISADGSTEIKIYYTRETVTFTIDLAGGKLGEQTGTVTKTGKYGQIISVADPTRSGYTFSGWNTTGGAIPATFDETKTYTALWTSASGITVTIAPASTISVVKSVSDDTITLTADSGFIGYTWLIDGTVASGMTGATVSEDGTMLTLAKANLTENAVYQVSLSATKDGIPYGAQISVKKEPARN